VPSFLNLLEPCGLIRHFHDHPPEGFGSLQLGDMPGFTARFDLLTTLDPAVRKKLERLPLATRWRRLLRWRACFAGTTVSEYALLPEGVSPQTLLTRIREESSAYPITIVKDLPTEATLVGQEAFDASWRLSKACSAAGFVLMEGQALAYLPIDFASIDHYLGRLSHARRKNLRRKLRSRAALTVEVLPTGDRRFDDDDLVAALYALYGNVYDQSELHFDRLTRAFFEAVLRDGDLPGLVFLYGSGPATIGFNLCFAHDGMLIDKYVGFAYPAAHEHNLYAVSWIENLHYALEHRLRTYVAGWTDPEIKRSLGARFTFTQHAVYIRNPLLRQLLKPFRRFFESDRQWQERSLG